MMIEIWSAIFGSATYSGQPPRIIERGPAALADIEECLSAAGLTTLLGNAPNIASGKRVY